MDRIRHDLRRVPLEVRKATLASTLARAGPGIRFSEHIEADGPTVFAHACKMGLEGIVSKRKEVLTEELWIRDRIEDGDRARSSRFQR